MASPRPAEAERPPPAAESGPGAGKLLLELAGAATGLLAFVSVAGGLVVRARLAALDLPADSVQPLLPKETSLFAGVQLLLPSIVLGAVLLFLLFLAGSSAVFEELHRRRSFIGVLIAIVIIVFGVAVYQLSEPISGGKQALVIVIAVLVSAVGALILWRAPSFRALVAGLFALLAVYTAVLGYLRASDPPIDLDFAVLTTKDGGRTSGFLLAQSSDAVLIAPDVENLTIGRVASVPRSDIVDLRVAPGPPGGVRPLRRDTRLQLVRSREAMPSPGGPAERLRSRVFLADVRGSTLWKYPPIMLPGSFAVWRRHYAEFAAYRVSPWVDDGVVVSLSQLNEEPNLFEGRIVITRGRLLAVARQPSGDAAVIRQFVVVESTDKRGFRTVCPVASPPSGELRPGGEVRLRGIPMAVGTFVSGSGTERRRVAMVCSAARRVGP